MFLLDDFLLATVIACIVLLVTNITSLLIIAAGVGLGLTGGGSDYIGGAKKEKKNRLKKDKPALKDKHALKDKKKEKEKEKEKEKKKEKEKSPVKLKEYSLIKHIPEKEKYDYVPFSDERNKQIDMYLTRAKNLYKKEKGNLSLFDIDDNLYHGQYKLKDKYKYSISDVNIPDLMHKRILDDTYFETFDVGSTYYDIHNITYNPINPAEYNKKIDKIFDYTILETIRELTYSEQKELKGIIYEFNSGKLTKPENKINFYDGTYKMVTNCNTRSLDKPYSNIYKKLHWGQRKLLLSEIDFFNRVALDIGRDKFKNNKMSLVYPGSATAIIC